MAQRLTPKKSIICALMVFVFPHAGISNKGLSITQTREEGTIILTCHLSDRDRNITVSQTGWMIAIGQNKTNLGTFHPDHGTYVSPQYRERVEIHSHPSTPHRTSLGLKDWPMNESSHFCCVFHTFPSGKLERCTSISHISADALTREETVGGDQRLAGRWTLLAGGTILAVSILSMCIFFCWRNILKRARVFEIQSAHSEGADSQPDSEAHAESTPQPSVSLGFEPSKLYAKIKQDLYYGRLWKSYQGRPQPREPGSLPTPRKIYSVVGEHSPPQKNKEES
ncbi:hypothetical protein ACEWY4_025420 [Coilia grayii]|uniref:Uncharacterized protein n=1 Tax=Coilia grayii TaxID=363190 RepID=A0ABD1IXM0_9TELE